MQLRSPARTCGATAALVGAILGSLLGSVASAEPAASLSLRSGVYQDSDRTFVSTSTAAMRGTIKGRVMVEGRYLADVITSASVDVISAGSTKPFSELRNEAAGGVTYRDADRSLGVSYVYSRENDWLSHTANVGLTHDFRQHNVTLGLGGTFVYNEVGRYRDPSFLRFLVVGGAMASLAITASPRDLVTVSYTATHLDGFQSSPYRFVYFGGALSTWEAHPETRLRHALTLRWNRHLFTDTVLRTNLRGYFDDWGVASLTAGVEYVIGFGDLSLNLHLRGYLQKQAGFYRPVYTERLRYMTADRELSTFVDGFGGATLTYRRTQLKGVSELRLEAKAEGFGFWFFDFPRLQARNGVVAELALVLAL